MENTNGIILTKNVEKQYIPDEDVAVQVAGNSRIYFTDDNKKPKDLWFFTPKHNEIIRIPSGKTIYFWCLTDNKLAIMSI